MFQKDEFVFYGSGGVCQIFDIQVSPLEGMPADRSYYVLRSLHDRNGVMYVPVDSEAGFMRRLMDECEAQTLIEQIPTVEVIDEPNAKLLRAKYVDAMRMHAPVEWVRVIKTVHFRTTGEERRVQRLSETERSFSEDAKRFLYTELAIALGMGEGEIKDYIAERLEKFA